MNCPRCKSKMETGAVHVRDTALGVLVAGFSYQPLFFIAKGKKEQQILRPNARRVAYKCGACQLIVMSCSKAS